MPRNRGECNVFYTASGNGTASVGWEEQCEAVGGKIETVCTTTRRMPTSVAIFRALPEISRLCFFFNAEKNAGHQLVLAFAPPGAVTEREAVRV